MMDDREKFDSVCEEFFEEKLTPSVGDKLIFKHNPKMSGEVLEIITIYRVKLFVNQKDTDYSVDYPSNEINALFKKADDNAD